MHKREVMFLEQLKDNGKQYIYEPGYFLLSNGTKYYPDFYCVEDNTYIEVVGTRQAYSFNKNKYKLFKFEIIRYDLSPYNEKGIITTMNGQRALWSVDIFIVPVIIQSIRESFGRQDYLIAPVSGSGEKWVQKGSLTFDEITGGEK